MYKIKTKIEKDYVIKYSIVLLYILIILFLIVTSFNWSKLNIKSQIKTIQFSETKILNYKIYKSLLNE